MAVGSFDELELLSQEDLIVETLRKLLKAYAELRRREDVTKDLLRSLCGFSLATMVWYTLFEGGGGITAENAADYAAAASPQGSSPSFTI